MDIPTFAVGHGEYGGLTADVYLAVVRATRALIERHGIYDVNRLSNFVTMNYSEIPSVAAPYIVLAATTAAQHVAQIHFMTETYRGSDDTRRMRDFSNAQGSIVGWSLGLRSPQRKNNQVNRDSSAMGDAEEYVPTPLCDSFEEV